MKNFMARSSHLMTSFQYIIWVLLFIFPFFFSLSFSDPRVTIDARFCGPIRAPVKTIIPTFVKVMEQVSQQVSNRNWGFQYLSTPPVLYALAQCHRDLTKVECLLCYAESRTKLPSCLPSVAGRIFLDGCFLRYDNHNFFNESIDPEYDTNQCNSSVVDESYARSVFVKKVDMVLVNSTEIAMLNEGFGVAAVKEGVDNVYALAQCWQSLSNNGCRECLLNARNELRKCVPRKEGRRLNAGCYLRYSTQKFYNDGQIKQALSAGTRKTVIIAIALSTVAFIMITIFGMFIGYARVSKKRKERDNLGRLPSAMNKSSLIIRYETLEKATDFFDPSRKLGQGGAGSVFKGTLPDGKNVAVKRLFFNTRQWVDEFFNEVNLINGIQHKNLVKLLGCSIEGPESLLVYEYLPNKSLDQFLFEKSKTQIVSWKQRFDIIVGIAEGLAYLHGGTQIRIIHRDIKSSNILLDENMTAKIADFGLARCFADDKSHLSTGIAGTLGYMAPEYLVRGQLTEKVDVYSFGVLVQEIVCGRKNSVFTQELGSVLQTVWQHYKSNTLPESVDPCLRGNFPVKEASDVLQVGLLCTQASVTLRPSMAEVVQMLTDKGRTIPLPMQPPFLNASVINPDTSSISYSMPSSVSNESATIEVSGPR